MTDCRLIKCQDETKSLYSSDKQVNSVSFQCAENGKIVYNLNEPEEATAELSSESFSCKTSEPEVEEDIATEDCTPTKLKGILNSDEFAFESCDDMLTDCILKCERKSSEISISDKVDATVERAFFRCDEAHKIKIQVLRSSYDLEAVSKDIACVDHGIPGDEDVHTDTVSDSYPRSQDECCEDPVDPCCDTHAPLVQVDILPAAMMSGCSCCGIGVSMCPCCASGGTAIHAQTLRGQFNNNGGGDSISPDDIGSLRTAISDLARALVAHF